MEILIGTFLILHGIVHFLYFGHSLRYFQLQPNFHWPDGAWVFSPLFKKKAIRILAGYFCVFAAVGFLLSGVVVFLHHPDWYFIAFGSALFSLLLFIIFWNGKYDKLKAQGIFAIIINFLLAVSIYFLHFPQFNF